MEFNIVAFVETMYKSLKLNYVEHTISQTIFLNLNNYMTSHALKLLANTSMNNLGKLAGSLTISTKYFTRDQNKIFFITHCY